MTTALTLVNRVRRLLREEDAGGLSDELSTVLLDLVDEAKRDILESRTWDFDLRTSGELTAKADIVNTSQDITVTNGSTTATVFPASSVGGSASALAGDYVARLIVTTDASFGDSAMRIVSATDAVGVNLTLATAWPGTTYVLAADFKIVFDEYLLPSTVREVHSVRHQETDLELHQVSGDRLDAIVQRPHEDVTDQPTHAYVGATIETTFDATSGSVSRGKGIRIYPTPDTNVLLNYTYTYRHPALSSSQDLLGVDGMVEDLIVRLAYARAMLHGIGNDPQTGVALESEVFARARDLYNAHHPMSRQHVSLIRDFRGIRGARDFGRIPRNVGEL